MSTRPRDSNAKAPSASTLFSGWEVKKEVLRPVIVNLLTASLFFLAAVLFKNPIYDYFTTAPKVAWPLYCVLEPQVSNGGPVTADLFVINVGGTRYVNADLEALATQKSFSDRKAVTRV